jgi:hypothetical protein
MGCAGFSLACEQIPAGESLWLRLTQPVSSYSAKPGDPVHAILTEDLLCGNELVAPMGSPVEGSVREVRKVGWGVKHETATLTIWFDKIIAGGRPLEMQSVVASVENAREQVTDGTIRGVVSTYTPQGRITSRLKYLPSLNPYPDIGLLLFKATFPIFPEPEIYLATATDLQLRLSKPVEHPATLVAPSPAAGPEDTAQLTALLGTLPSRSTTTTMTSADLVNLVFLGTPEQLQSAFTHAGWQTTDPFNKHTFMLNFYAFLNNSGYARAPMRPFLLQGRPPDMNWQKSLNSYARRDHLRLWQWPEPFDGQPVWLSAATHDAGAALSVKHREFVHHISPNLDEERSKVIRDLKAAGCVQSVSLVPRHGAANLTQNAIGDPVRTDGAVAVVQLKECHAPAPELASAPTTAPYKPGNALFRYLRRSVLTFRSDLWRANIIYAGYDLGRMTVHAWRHRSDMSPVAAAAESPKKPGTAVDSSGAGSGTNSMD